MIYKDHIAYRINRKLENFEKKFESHTKKTMALVDKNPVLAVAIAVAVPQIVGYTALSIVTRP